MIILRYAAVADCFAAWRSVWWRTTGVCDIFLGLGRRIFPSLQFCYQAALGPLYTQMSAPRVIASGRSPWFGLDVLDCFGYDPASGSLVSPCIFEDLTHWFLARAGWERYITSITVMSSIGTKKMPIKTPPSALVNLRCICLLGGAADNSKGMGQFTDVDTVMLGNGASLPSDSRYPHVTEIYVMQQMQSMDGMFPNLRHLNVRDGLQHPLRSSTLQTINARFTDTCLDAILQSDLPNLWKCTFWVDALAWYTASTVISAAKLPDHVKGCPVYLRWDKLWG